MPDMRYLPESDGSGRLLIDPFINGLQAPSDSLPVPDVLACLHKHNAGESHGCLDKALNSNINPSDMRTIKDLLHTCVATLGINTLSGGPNCETHIRDMMVDMTQDRKGRSMSEIHQLCKEFNEDIRGTHAKNDDHTHRKLLENTRLYCGHWGTKMPQIPGSDGSVLNYDVAKRLGVLASGITPNYSYGVQIPY